MRTKEEIEELLELYLDGETTCEQESELHAYFASVKSNDIPTEWQCYKALFDYEDKQATKAEVISLNAKKSINLHKSAWWFAAAASVAIVIGIAIHTTESQANIAYINGVKTTNSTLVEKQAQEALASVSLDDDDLFSALNY